MKLGLLVVLAVAAVVPSLSEGRIVSRCELRETLGKAIDLPKKLQKHKETVLAKVICVLEEKSNLNTSVVSVFRKPKAPASTELTDTDVDGGKSRKRREADNSSEEDDGMGLDSILEELEEDQSDEVDMDEDGDMEGDDYGDEMDEDEQELEEGGKRKKRSMRHHHRRHRRRQKAHTRYGLFQLPDRHCDSPSHPSKNTCETTCGAFTDDDIEDDIGCFVKTKHWKRILRGARWQCREIEDFFEECN